MFTKTPAKIATEPIGLPDVFHQWLSAAVVLLFPTVKKQEVGKAKREGEEEERDMREIDKWRLRQRGRGKSPPALH